LRGVAWDTVTESPHDQHSSAMLPRHVTSHAAHTIVIGRGCSSDVLVRMRDNLETARRYFADTNRIVHPCG